MIIYNNSFRPGISYQRTITESSMKLPNIFDELQTRNAVLNLNASDSQARFKDTILMLHCGLYKKYIKIYDISLLRINESYYIFRALSIILFKEG